MFLRMHVMKRNNKTARTNAKAKQKNKTIRSIEHKSKAPSGKFCSRSSWSGGPVVAQRSRGGIQVIPTRPLAVCLASCKRVWTWRNFLCNGFYLKRSIRGMSNPGVMSMPNLKMKGTKNILFWFFLENWNPRYVRTPPTDKHLKCPP